MKRVKRFIKSNIKVLIAFILGLVIAGGIGTYVYAEIVIQGTDVGYTDTNNIGATDVQNAIDKLYVKAKNAGTSIEVEPGLASGRYYSTPCIAPTLNEGDYITLVPSKSEYRLTSEESPTGASVYLQPNELTLWRVIKENACNVEVVSEYVSSQRVYFTGTVGYKYFVGGLNAIAAAYENPTYTVGSRMMGFDEQTGAIEDTSAFNESTDTVPSETTTPSPTTGTGQEYSGGVLGDTLYLKDYTLVSNVYKSDTTTYGSSGLKAYKIGTTTATAYCLASRGFKYNSATSFSFIGRSVNTSGSLSNFDLRRFNSIWIDNMYSCAVRPILILKSGITTSGGSGTMADPYTLS